jgi:hypothetical protein
MWFMLCGCHTSIPVEPTHYDLLASMDDGVKRVQVKTTTYEGKTGWMIQVGRHEHLGSRCLRRPIAAHQDR